MNKDKELYFKGGKMTEAYINVNLNITEGTSLDEIISTLTKIKDEMDKINVELYSAIYQTQVFLTSEKKEK